MCGISRTSSRGSRKPLKVGVNDIPARIAKLTENMKAQKKLEAQGSGAPADIKVLLENTAQVGSCRVLVAAIEKAGIAALRDLSNRLREEGNRLVYVVATSQDGKLHVIAGLSADLLKSGLDMKVLFGRLSSLLQVSGGGKTDLVQGGGPDQGQFAATKAAVEGAITEYLKEKGL